MIEKVFAHIYFDAILTDDAETEKFADNNTQAIAKSFFCGKGKIMAQLGTIENKQYCVLQFTKEYTTGERVGKFFTALAQTVCTLGFGLFDQRVRHNWDAVVFGEVEKKVAISEEQMVVVAQKTGVEVLKRGYSAVADAVTRGWNYLWQSTKEEPKPLEKYRIDVEVPEAVEKTVKQAGNVFTAFRTGEWTTAATKDYEDLGKKAFSYFFPSK